MTIYYIGTHLTKSDYIGDRSVETMHQLLLVCVFMLLLLLTTVISHFYVQGK